MPPNRNAKLLYFDDGNARIYFRHLPRPRAKSGAVIKIDSRANVFIHLPKGASDQHAIAVAKSHQNWILKRLQQINARRSQQAARPKMAFYLGQKIPLLIQTAPRPQVILAQQTITVHTPNPQNADDVLQKWYRQQALAYMPARLAHLMAQTPWVKTRPPIKIRRAKKRWGSCSAAGNINLNSQLMKLPPECIDMVIIHELCHLKVFNHSAAFYQLMDQVLPSWRQAQQTLNALCDDVDWMDY